MSRPGESACKPVLSAARLGLVFTSLWVGAVLAQQETTQGIYTCTDARGRTLTAERPIPECLDREQKVLNPSGSLKARVGPTLTLQERAELDAKNKADQDERARLNEEKRRERALLIRYPNKLVHDKERAEALAQIGVMRQAALTRTQELLRQRADIDKEMEFYQKDPSKAPPSLRRQEDEMTQSLAVQGRFIAVQDTEFKRVNARFEEELARLKPLWALQAPGSTAPVRRIR